MLDFEDPEQNLTNIAQLPLVISMTCYTGSFDGNKNSLAEELLRSENGGAIAVIGATSIGLLDGDYFLNAEIFDVIFNQQRHNPRYRPCTSKNPVFLINAPGFLDLAEVFTLFGDPATDLKIPSNNIQVTTDISTDQRNAVFSVSGTLPDRSFSGDAEITVVPQQQRPLSRKAQSRNRKSFPSSMARSSAEIRVPTDPEFDVGAVQIYGWNAEEDAIGHATYDILSLYVRNVRIAPFPVQPHKSTHLYAEVVDKNAIDEMTLFWSLNGHD